MSYMAYCFKECGNPVTPMPLPPGPWNPGPVVPPTPVLNITCPVIPTSVVATTAAPFRITVNGTLFTASTQGTFDGTPMPSTVVSAGQLWFEIDPAAYAVGPHTIGVTDGGVIGATTCPFEIITALLTPTLSYIWPDMVGQEDPTGSKTITYTGTNFDATSRIFRGVLELPTTLVNATTLTTTVDQATATSAMFEMRVRNGVAPTYAWSNNLQATSVPSPRLNMLNKTSTPAGGGVTVFPVQIWGWNFIPDSEVLIDGVPTPARFMSGGGVEFDVNPSIQTPGTVIQVGIRLGHYHPEGHDDVRCIQPPATLPFTFT